MGTDEAERNRLEALATTLGTQADRIDRLERELGLDDGEQVDIGEVLATLVDAQADRIDRLERELGLDDTVEGGTRRADIAGEKPGVDAPDSEHPRMSRRTLVKLAGLTGLLGYGTGTVAADPVGTVGSQNRPLRAAYTQRIGGGVVDNRVVTSLLGTGLSVEGESLSAAEAAADHVDVGDGDGSGTVVENATELAFDDNLSVSDEGDGTVSIDSSDSTGPNTHTDVSDDGSTAVTNTTDIDFGSNLSVSADGDGSATVDAVSTAAWVDGDADGLLEPADGSKTGIEKLQTIAGDGSVSVDIDHNADGTSETFSVTHDDGTALLTVNESGEVDLDAGALDTNGNDVTSSSGGFSITTDSGNLTLNPASDIDAGSNNITNLASVDNGGSSISVDDTLDVQSGTVTNGGGSLTVQTGGSNNDLSLSPSGSISATAAIQADNGLTTSSGDLTLSPGGNVALSSATLDAGGNGIINLASVDNGGSPISVDDDLDASGNAVTTDKLNGADISSSAAADKVMTTDGSGNLSLNDAVVGKSSNYEIQKDGSDTSGVINFKTV